MLMVALSDIFSKSPRTFNMIILLISAISLLLSSLLLWAADSRPQSAIDTTDYVTTLYIAGHMVRNHAQEDIYPARDGTTFKNEKFETYGRKLLNDTSSNNFYLFPYPPLIALVTSVICFTTPTKSLIIWQSLSALSLFLSAWLFANLQNVKQNALFIFIASSAFFPVFNVLVVGQTSLLLGLLPLVGGYFLWMKNKPLEAGLAWSFLALKPQLLIPIAILLATLFADFLLNQTRLGKSQNQSNFQPKDSLLLILGVCLGIACLASLSVLIVGLDLNMGWLNAVHISGEMYGKLSTGYWQYHLFISLPCIILFCLPQALKESARLPTYALGGALMLVAVAISLKTLHLALDKDTRKELLVIICVFFLVLAAPHLLLYDATLLLLPAWIVLFRWTRELQFYVPAVVMILLIGMAFDTYLAAILVPGNRSMVPWQVALISVFIGSFGSFIIWVFKQTKSHSQPEANTVERGN
jgi:hypothetical protein